jgi:AP-2 complex subunit mu-1
MITGIFFLTAKGDVIISRMFRDNVHHTTAEQFRESVILSKDSNKPVFIAGETSFIYVKHGSMFLVAGNRNKI